MCLLFFYLKKRTFHVVNDVSSGSETIPDYANAAGIQSIAFETVLRNDIVTPYGSFPGIDKLYFIIPFNSDYCTAICLCCLYYVL